MRDNNLKLIYSEILQGYSPCIWHKKNCYIKHLSSLDSSIVDIKRQEYLESFISKGGITYNEKLEELIKRGLWSQEKDDRIKAIRDFIVDLRKSKQKYTLKKDIKLVDSEIEKYENELFDLIYQKEKLIGKTAESYADRKSNEYYVYVSFYLDNELKNRLFSQDEFDELDEEELKNIIFIYNKKMEIFSDNNLKKISLSAFFMNMLILVENNYFNIFGKPMVQLTFYQSELIQNGRMFKNMLQNAKIQPPQEVMSDPQKLIDWINKSDNLEQAIGDRNVEERADEKIISAGKSVVGMTKEEMNAANIDTSVQDKIRNAAKKKGELSLSELMSLGV